MTDKQIIDRVNVKECKYYCNGKCERYEEFVEADYANYSVKCICEKENDLGTYDICDYQQLQRKEQECERLKEIANNALDKVNNYLDNKEKSLLYKQTLTEIKEIAEKLKNFYEELGKCEGLTIVRLKQILQKISECETR